VIAAAELKWGHAMSQPLASFQISSSFQDILTTVFHSIPKILIFLFVLIVGWFAATAAVVMLALGVNAALNQVGIAATVTQPVLYAVLLTCGAIIAIGVGGGLVKPMQARWERMLTAAEREAVAYQQGRADALRAAHDHGQQLGEQPAAHSEPNGHSAGPRCLQSHGVSRGVGYLQSPVFAARQADAGQSQETEVPDDPENYPGGQYM
jgi:hypothetical protein